VVFGDSAADTSVVVNWLLRMRVLIALALSGVHRPSDV
jgi:hypothetical protein